MEGECCVGFVQAVVSLLLSVCVCVELCAISSIQTTVIKPVIQGQACVCMSVCISSHTLPEGHVSLSHAHTRVIPDE